MPGSLDEAALFDEIALFGEGCRFGEEHPYLPMPAAVIWSCCEAKTNVFYAAIGFHDYRSFVLIS